MPLHSLYCADVPF